MLQKTRLANSRRDTLRFTSNPLIERSEVLKRRAEFTIQKKRFDFSAELEITYKITSLCTCQPSTLLQDPSPSKRRLEWRADTTSSAPPPTTTPRLTKQATTPKPQSSPKVDMPNQHPNGASSHPATRTQGRRLAPKAQARRVPFRKPSPPHGEKHHQLPPPALIRKNQPHHPTCPVPHQSAPRANHPSADPSAKG